MNLAQARVIVHALEDLPETEVPADILASAEAHLIDQATCFSPKHLAVLGRKILEVVAPETYEDQEAKALEAEEARARAGTSLFRKRLGEGRTRITLNVPDGVADRLGTYLEAFTNPRRGDPRDPAWAETFGVSRGSGEKCLPYSANAWAERSVRLFENPWTPNGSRYMAVMRPR